MKKIVLFFFTLLAFTACENEPLDLDFTDDGLGNIGNNENGNNENSTYFPSTLNIYLDANLPLFGQTITNATINYNASPNYVIAQTVNGTTFNYSLTYNNRNPVLTNNITVSGQGFNVILNQTYTYLN